LDLLAWMRTSYPTLPVIVSTAYGTVETAVAAVARGAFDYLPKPLELDRTLAVVARALGETRLAAAAQPAADHGEALIGRSPAMQEVYRRIAAAAPTDLGVLISGASGTGKELVARTIHANSPRRDGPFVVLNCGALPETGGSAGPFAAATGGTILLDNVDELPAADQAALARLDDEGAVVRVMAATTADLARRCAAGGFRDDLLYRLRVVSIALPTVAERSVDLPELVRHALGRAARRLNRALAITDAAQDLLLRQSWPGNVRELNHVIAEAAALAGGGVIGVEHLALGPAAPAQGNLDALLAAEADRMLLAHPGEAHQRLLERCELAAVRAALARTAGNQLRAAEMLGINRTTLKKRMEQAGL
jgi:two-component system nitrogen regulation response regulator GlnG